jgi:hypothetical protein
MLPGRFSAQAHLQRNATNQLPKDFAQVDFAISHEVRAAERIVSSSNIEEHEFFSLARDNKRAVREWVAQELTVTNGFSQRLLSVAAQFSNVFIRQHLLDLIIGEHSTVGNDGVEYPAHPLLLQKAATIVGITVDQVVMRTPTAKYLDTLRRLCELGPLQALGAIGVGNELLLVREYTAARVAYTSAFSREDGAEFFDANISADGGHYELCAGAASAYCDLYNTNSRAYIDGARRAVQARVHFYDSLVAVVRNDRG